MGLLEILQNLSAYGIVNNSSSVLSVLSVSSDSLAPARLALRANLRLLYLIGPAFSIVVKSAAFGFKVLQQPNQ